MNKPIPDLSPLVAVDLICHSCGSRMKPAVVKMKRGQDQVVSHLEYTCKNPKSGCNYKVQSTTMHSGEMVALRPDGSEIRIGE